MTSCCDFDFLGRDCVGGLLPSQVSILCRDLKVMSRPQGNVATSFAAYFFSSGRNLSYLLQLIFLLPTFIPGRDLKVMS